MFKKKFYQFVNEQVNSLLSPFLNTVFLMLQKSCPLVPENCTRTVASCRVSSLVDTPGNNETKNPPTAPTLDPAPYEIPSFQVPDEGLPPLQF